MVGPGFDDAHSARPVLGQSGGEDRPGAPRADDDRVETLALRAQVAFRCSSRSRSSRRRIFPLIVFGSDGTNSISRGY